MPPDEQLKVFKPSPSGKRKFILSTNIAETSVTISGIKYGELVYVNSNRAHIKLQFLEVVDSGFVKMRLINATTGIEMLKVSLNFNGQAIFLNFIVCLSGRPCVQVSSQSG